MRKTDRYRVTYEGQDKLSPAAKKAQRSTNDLHKATKGLSGSFGQLGMAVRSALPFLTGAAVIGGMTKMIKMTADAGDKFAKMSQKLGVSVETLSTFDHVAKLSGITIDVVGVGLRRFAQNALDMSRGIGEAKREFEALGISVTNSEGKVREMEDLILDVADRFSEMEDGTTKTAMAMRLFGRSGSEMIPMLNKGSAGIREMMDEAEKLGLVFSQESAKAMEQFNDSMQRVKGQMKGFTYDVMIPAIKTLSKFLDILGYGPKLTLVESYRESIKKVKEEIEKLEETLADESLWGKAQRLGIAIDSMFMGQESIEEMEQRLLKLRSELNYYEKELNSIIESEKKDAEAKKQAADAARIKAETTKKSREEGEKEAASLESLGEKHRTTYESIGEAMLARVERGQYMLDIIREEREAEIAMLTDLGEKHRSVYQSIGEQMLYGTEVGRYMLDELGEKNEEFAGTVEDAMGRVEGAVNSSVGALISGTFSWKSALSSLLSSLVSFLIRKGAKKFKEMIAEGAEQTAKALESAAEYDYAGVALHGFAAAGYYTAASKWATLKHKGGMIEPFGKTFRDLRADERPIIAKVGEGVLSERGVAAIGGPAAVDLANRGISIGRQSIIMTNTMGPITNMADVERIGEVLAEKWLSAIRETP